MMRTARALRQGCGLQADQLFLVHQLKFFVFPLCICSGNLALLFGQAFPREGI